MTDKQNDRAIARETWVETWVSHNERITMDEVANLANILSGILPQDKAIVKTFQDAKKDGMAPSEVAKLVLGSAYDWFAYGN